MMTKTFTFGIITCCFLLLGPMEIIAQQPLNFSDDGHLQSKADYPVQVSISPTTVGEDGKHHIQLTITIEKDWCIFGNPVGVQELEFAETTVKFVASKQLAALVVFPKGDLVNDDSLGNYIIYKGKITIPVTLLANADEIRGSELRVRVYPFNQATGKCTHLQKTLKQKLP